MKKTKKMDKTLKVALLAGVGGFVGFFIWGPISSAILAGLGAYYGIKKIDGGK
jgi:hypothetical protein